MPVNICIIMQASDQISVYSPIAWLFMISGDIYSAVPTNFCFLIISECLKLPDFRKGDSIPFHPIGTVADKLEWSFLDSTEILCSLTNVKPLHDSLPGNSYKYLFSSTN